MASAEEFLIKLQEQISGPAGKAESALNKLEAQIKREQDALAGLEGKLSSAQKKLAFMQEGGAGGKKVDLLGIDQQRAKIAALEAAIGKSKGGLSALMGARGNIAGASEEQKVLGKKKAMLEVLSNEQVNYLNAVKSAGGPLGSLAEKIENVSSIMGRAGGVSEGLAVVGIGGLVSAIAALAVAAAAAAAVLAALTVAITTFAIASADAARSQRLFNDAAGGSVARGAELNTVINDIASRVPLAKAEVAKFGRELEIAGLQGRRMQVALEAITMLEAVIPGAGAKIEDLAKRFQKLKTAILTKEDLAGTGVALDEVAAQLAKTMHTSIANAKAMLQNGTAGVDNVLNAIQKAIEKKFGKTMAAQMMALGTQWEKFKENIAGLFAGIDLEPFLAALKTITDLFSQNTVTGRVLKTIVTAIFQGLFDTLAKLAPIMRSLFLGAAIYAIKFYIAMKPVVGVLMFLARSESFLTGLKLALMLIALPFIVIGAVILGAIIAVGLFIAVMASLVYAVLSAIGFVVNLVVSGWQAIIGVFMQGAGMAQSAGSGLIDGFVAGIQGGLGAVMAAVSSIGQAAESALRAALGWHSPARLGVDAAVAVGEGVEVGADKASDGAGDAIGGLVNPAQVKAGAKGAKGGGKGVVYIEQLNIGSRDDFEAFRRMLAGEFEVNMLAGPEPVT